MAPDDLRSHPRGERRLTAKGRATRDRIVDAAADLVVVRGVAGLSLDEVLEVTGTSKSQLYHYFDDRSDLVRAVIARHGERILGPHGAVLASAPGWEALAAWRDLVVETTELAGCHGGCPVGSLANELVELDPAARHDLIVVFDDWTGLLAGTLRRMVEVGELDEDAPVDDLALATIASLQGGSLLAKTTLTTRPVEVALDTALAHVRSYATVAPVGEE